MDGRPNHRNKAGFSNFSGGVGRGRNLVFDRLGKSDLFEILDRTFLVCFFPDGCSRERD